MTRAAFLLAVAAAGLMLPSLIMGTMPSHSSMHDMTWAAQFSDQFRAGVLYPRWMSDSFLGLGAPSFFFYPPLAFWVDALVRIVTIDAISTSWRLSVTATLLLWMSGMAFHAWLRQNAAGARAALFGAIAYMAAPYHLVDHYLRGALAEFAAYAALPLVMCSITLVARRYRGGVPLLALAYAGLIASHLPTALLISLTAIPAYSLVMAARAREKDRWFLLRCAAGFSLGLALAAIYLLPALTLQDAVLIDWMWKWGFKVEESYLLMPWRWVQPPEMYMAVASIAGAWSLAALAVVVLRRTPDVTLWAGVALGTTLLMSGLIPWEKVPMVSKVGFAWRLLIVMEFAAITALCLAPWGKIDRTVKRLFLLMAIAMAPAVVLLVVGISGRIDLMHGRTLFQQDAREYLPAGYPQRHDAAYLEIGLELIKDVPLIACQPSARVCQAEPGRFGDLRIAVDSDQPTLVTLRRFAFPAWQLDASLPLVATEPLRLVSFTAPAGAHRWTLQRRTLSQQKCGGLISAAALLVLLAGLAAPRLRARRSSA